MLKLEQASWLGVESNESVLGRPLKYQGLILTQIREANASLAQDQKILELRHEQRPNRSVLGCTDFGISTALGLCLGASGSIEKLATCSRSTS